jgi:hypothetical protein
MLTFHQAACHLGVSEALLIELCNEQKFPCLHDNGGDGVECIRLRHADVEHCLHLCAMDPAELLPNHFRSLEAFATLSNHNPQDELKNKHRCHASPPIQERPAAQHM